MDEINRERAFLEKMQDVLRKAKFQGNGISEEEIAAEFADLELTDEQMKQVKDYLTANHIGIGHPVNTDELLTKEEHNYLNDYMEMVSSIEQPDPGVMDALKLSAMAGETDAQKKLAECMLPKVVDIAKLYVGQGVFLEDLIGTGNEALTRGVRLLAPLEGPEEVEGRLGEMIMNAMEDLVSENLDESAKGEEAAEKVNRVADAAHSLAEDLGRKVTVEELAGEGELSESEIMDAIEISANNIPDIDYRKA
ncbi:MAG: sigma-70 domain-containing protein [Lachnospiraceae bacterium]|jgi:RNA polymerase primary sigma factor|nr:sigma-70 domain-containing protein [Lachnospiraceae bacterium]